MSKNFLIFFFLLSTFTFADQSPKEIEAQLKSTFENQVLTIRHFYPGKKLKYNADGELPNGKPGEWIADGNVFVKKVSIDKDNLRIEGQRAIAQFELKNPKPSFINSKDHIRITVPLPADFSAEKIITLLGRIFYKKDENFSADLPLIFRNFVEKYRDGPATTGGPKISEDMGIYKVAPGITPPKPMSTPEPEYSQKARAIRFQGVVTLSLIVDQEGRPQDIQLLKPLGLGLDEKAIDAVSRWRFDPAKRKNGVPVPVIINVEVSFNLY